LRLEDQALLNLPNAITVMRIALVPVIIYLLAHQAYIPALWVFLAAGVSDALDGFLARRLNQFTPFGAALDPIADKLMILATLGMLTWLDLIPVWLTMVIVARDLIVVSGAIAYRMMSGTIRVTPTWLGKFNVFLEFALLAFVQGNAADVVEADPWLSALFPLVFVTTAGSGVQYVWIWSRKALQLKRTGQ
jgi:cardiolipin synthase